MSQFEEGSNRPYHKASYQGLKLVQSKNVHMHQTKVSLTEPLAEFLDRYKQYGFKDKSAMMRAALVLMKQELEQRQLHESAALYAEVYAEDEELLELTDSALAKWPA